MTDAEIELAILRQYAAKHKDADLAAPGSSDKCARELDMRDVVRGLSAYPDVELDYHTRMWFDRLAPPHGHEGPLRRCSNTRLSNDHHRFHARASVQPGQSSTWDRIRELEAAAPAAPAREMEQKFRIVFSPGQARADFRAWTDEGTDDPTYSIGVIFLDIDNFKVLNERHSHVAVDEGVLRPLQELLRRMTRHRGGAYRYGGEEFLILLPNHQLVDTSAFAERLRHSISVLSLSIGGTPVLVTASIGVSAWPRHGTTFDAAVASANALELEAKQAGKNSVRTAD